jgi:hypothetical protein
MNTASIFAKRQALTWLLGGLSAAMLVTIAVETDGGQRWKADMPVTEISGRGTGDEGILPPFSLPPIDPAYKETVERPLFAWTRRPAPNGAGVEAMRKGQYKLAGTSINDTLTMVFLQEVASGKTVRVEKGKEILGTRMVVDTVEPARVVLKQGEDSEELKLVTAPSPKVVAPPPGAPGAPGTPGAPGGVPPNQPGQAPGVGPGVPGSATPGVNPGLPNRPPGFLGGVPAAGNANGAAIAPRSAADANANTTPTPADAAAQRRRRFQNLPQ